MCRYITNILLSVFIVLGTPSGLYAFFDVKDNGYEAGELKEHINADIYTFFEVGGLMRIGRDTEMLYQYDDVKSIYQQRNYMPIWQSRQNVIALIDFIQNAMYEGLNPENSDYNLQSIYYLLEFEDAGSKDALEPSNRAKLDILLTDAFMALAYHMHFGMAYNIDVGEQHMIHARTLDIASVLEVAVEQEQVAEQLRRLAPIHPGYQKLREALAFYMAVARSGGWENVAQLTASDTAAHYQFDSMLQERLLVTEDYYANGTTPHLRDSERLNAAIMRFQKRHGLKADGIIGQKTLAALNMPVTEAIRKIVVNMERWKWMPEFMETNYIVVNIPDFKLSVVEGNASVLDMKVIVGKEQRETPTFDAKMSNLVFNPYWRVPETILEEDLLPKIKENVGYLKEKNIKIFRADDLHEYSPIDPSEIDWREVDEESVYHYKFRQEPGPNNPLGYVKFMFPNRFNVYIHDTPAKEKFDFDKGMFSSGCIRVKRPIELAAYLLKKDHPDITYKDIFDEVLNGKVKGVWFKNPLHVYITYQTAWVDEEGMVNFRDDIYGFDEHLLFLLQEKL